MCANCVTSAKTTRHANRQSEILVIANALASYVDIMVGGEGTKENSEHNPLIFPPLLFLCEGTEAVGCVHLLWFKSFSRSRLLTSNSAPQTCARTSERQHVLNDIPQAVDALNSGHLTVFARHLNATLFSFTQIPDSMPMAEVAMDILNVVFAKQTEHPGATSVST